MMFPRGSGLLRPAIVAAAFLVGAPAQACVVCLPYPTKTSADTIIESDTVVLAREDPARPFTYVPIEEIKGRYDGVAIPVLLNATSAHALRLNPASTAVLAQDRPGGAWTPLGLAGPEHQAVLRQVAAWSSNSGTAAERAAFFAPYLGHEDRALADLAFLEIGRARYATIRELPVRVERDELYRVINDWFRVEWHGLYVLMLGLSDRPDDIAFVRGRLWTAAEYGLTTNLAAYATAFIEMNGAEAVKQLAERYFADPNRSRDELIEIAKALSVQGSGGRVELRPAIVDAYGQLLSQNPELAGYVATDLLDWKVARFVPRMQEIRRSGVELDEASQLAIGTYLALLPEAPAGARALPTMFTRD